MKKFFIFFIFSFFILNINPVFADVSSSGFIKDAIWYSVPNFTEGDSIYIHTAIWNQEKVPISGKVQFLDQDTILATRDFSIPVQTLKDISVPWKVTAGDHKISVKITGITLASSSMSDQDIFIPKKIKNGEQSSDVTSVLTDKVNEVLPEQVAVPVNKSAIYIDTIREDTSNSLEKIYENTNKKIESLNKNTNSDKVQNTKEKVNTKTESSTKANSPTDKPIAYVELFFVSIALFIFKHPIVFYILLSLIVFFILRAIYRKVRS